MDKDEEVYMGISFTSIPRPKAKEIVQLVAANLPGLSFNVHYAMAIEDDEEESHDH